MKLKSKTTPVKSGKSRVPDLIMPKRIARNAALIQDDARAGGLMIFGPSGWGKSRLLGRSICHQNALRGIGTVVLDVVGGTIDNALDKILYLSREEQLAVGDRLRYCNMAGESFENNQTRVTAWPILAKRSATESLYETSQRKVELLSTIDRALASASVQGLNRLAPLLTSVGMILSALELPITLAFDLFAEPEKWRERIEEAVLRNPDALEAAVFLLAFLKLPDRVREERTEVLLNKLSILRFDPVSRAMFSAREALIDWDEVAHNGLQVYIDLRFETSAKARELKLFWVWNSLMEYVRSRGSAGHEYPPLAVVIDELSYFVRGTQLDTDVISEEFREFVQVRMRNANIWLTCATQELLELPESIGRACLQMKNQLYGATTEFETALAYAKRWYEMDPWEVKYWQRVWATDTRGGGFGIPTYSSHFVIDHTPIFLSLDEQLYRNSRNFTAQRLKKGEWLFAQSAGEGELATTLRRVSTKNLDPKMYESQNKATIKKLRRRLMQRDGILVSDVLSEVNSVRTESLPFLETDQEASLPPVSTNGSGRAPTPLSGAPTHHEEHLDGSVTGSSEQPQSGRRFGALPPDED